MEHYPEGQIPCRLHGSEGTEGIGSLDGVNAGDPQSVGHDLGIAHGAEQAVRTWSRKGRRHQVDGPFKQEAGGLAVGIANDDPAKWIGGVPVDPGDGQGSGVDPRRVDIEAVQEDWAGMERIELAPVWRRIPFVGIESLAQDPALFGDPGCDPGQHLRLVPDACQLHPPPVQRPGREMGMAVYKARGDQGPRQFIPGDRAGHLPSQFGG